MVVAEWKMRVVAMQVQYHIAINIHKVVALALLEVHKPMNLYYMISL